LNPPDGFVLALVNYCNVQNEEDFLYAEPDWPEQAAALDVNHPPNASVSAFVTSLGTEITFVNAGNAAQMQDDLKQLCSRIMRAYKEVYKSKDRPSIGAPDGEDLDVRTTESMAEAFASIYGETVVVSTLATSAICNSLHRQLSTGMVVDDLKSMLSRATPRRGKPKLEFDLESGRSKASSSYTKSIDTPAEFLERLHTYVTTLVYVSTMHVAPADQWGGKALHGVVRGVRYQFSRAGADHYLSFWRSHADKFKSNVSALVNLETEVRSTWVDKFGSERMSLESSMRESLTEKGGKVEAWSPKRHREGDEYPVGRGDGGKGGTGMKGGKGGGGKGSDGGKGKVDVSTLPGFRIGCRPFTGRWKGKEFCKHYNRGTVCWHGAGTCPNWHKCDTTLASGEPCAQDHSRQQHEL
jgi:uncharacterized membrane protein YgcG